MADNVEAQALQYIKSEVLRVRALTALSEKLENAGSWEKLIREKQLALGNIEQAQAEADRKIARLADLDAQIADAEKQIADLTAKLAPLKALLAKV